MDADADTVLLFLQTGPPGFALQFPALVKVWLNSPVIKCNDHPNNEAELFLTIYFVRSCLDLCTEDVKPTPAFATWANRWFQMPLTPEGCLQSILQNDLTSYRSQKVK